jgi:hypothetical protein
VLQRLGKGLLGLARQRLAEQLAAQAAAQLDDEFLDVAEAGAPRRPLGAPKVVQQVFRRRLQYRANVRGNFYRRTLFCHLEFLSAVATILKGASLVPF